MWKFSDIKHSVFEAVYPSKCLSCGRHGRWFCEGCRLSIERAPLPCPACLSVTQHACNGTLPFSGIVTLGFYHSRPLRRLIYELKYNGLLVSHEEIERFFLDRLLEPNWEFPWDRIDSIQPLPLESNKLRQRGFNQSEIIAGTVQRIWLPHIPIIHALERIHAQFAQASIQQHELRKQNIAKAFMASKNVRGSVLLVDDVVTTGSTAAEAARTLLRAGASSVYLMSLAIGK